MSRQLALVIDLDRCIGCRGGCQVACKLEHGIALGDSRSRMHVVESGTYPDLEMYFLPVMCQQCGKPSCTVVCPTGACYKDLSDGVIKIDKNRCVGCESCKRACPYGAMNLNKEMRVMDKCDICSDLRANGETPACVRNCSGKAISVAESPEEGYSLPDEGNRPSGRFILRNAEWKEAEL